MIVFHRNHAKVFRLEIVSILCIRSGMKSTTKRGVVLLSYSGFIDINKSCVAVRMREFKVDHIKGRF